MRPNEPETRMGMPRVFAWESAHRMFAGRVRCWSQRTRRLWE
jgi:hypothetical protein